MYVLYANEAFDVTPTTTTSRLWYRFDLTHQAYTRTLARVFRRAPRPACLVDGVVLPSCGA